MKGMRENTELLQVQPAKQQFDPQLPLRDKRMNISQNRLPQILNKCNNKIQKYNVINLPILKQANKT